MRRGQDAARLARPPPDTRIASTTPHRTSQRSSWRGRVSWPPSAKDAEKDATMVERAKANLTVIAVERALDPMPMTKDLVERIGWQRRRR